MKPLETLPDVLQRWEAWWNRTNSQPIIYCLFSEGDFSTLERRKAEWMSPTLTDRWSSWGHEHLFSQALELHLRTGEDRYMEEVIAYFQAYPAVTGSAAEGFSFLHLSMGAACLSAFVSGYSKFMNDTVWFERPEAFEWEEMIACFTRSNPFVEAVDRWFPKAVEALREHFVIAIPDFGTDMDVLSPLRHTQNLLMDTCDEPERIHQVLPMIHDIWQRRQDWARRLIAPGNHGCHTMVMRCLGAEPVHLAYCDFSAMISPAMFEEFVLPGYKDECRRFPGRTVFHLDGPGEIPHLDLICNEPGLHAVQWVQGAGNPGSLNPRWDDLYRRILDHGKRVCLCAAPCDADALNAFFKRFPKQEFLVPLYPPDRATAERIISAV